MTKKQKKKLLSIVLALVLLAALYIVSDMLSDEASNSPTYIETSVIDLSELPEYSGEATAS